MPYVPEHRIGPQQSKGFQFKCLNGASPGFTVGQQGPTGSLKAAMDTWETAWGTPIELVAIGTNTNFGAQSSTWLSAVASETRFKLLAVSLVPQSGGSITKLLNGDYDAAIIAMFQSMIGAGIGTGLDVCCRIGWEFNSGSAGNGTPGAYPSGNYNNGFPWATGHIDSQTGTANGIAQVHLAQAYFENLIRQPSVGYNGYIEWNGGTQDTSALPIATAMPTHATGVNKAKTLWGWDIYPGVPFNSGKDNVAAIIAQQTPIYNGYVAYCQAHGYMMGHGEYGQTYKISSQYVPNDVLTWFPWFYGMLASNAGTVAYAALYHQNQHVTDTTKYSDLTILDESHQMWGAGGFSGTPSTTVWTGIHPLGTSTFNTAGSLHTQATMGSLQGVDTTPASWTPTTDANKQNAYTSFMNNFGGNDPTKGSPGLQAATTQPNTSDSAPAVDSIKVTRSFVKNTTDYATKNMLANPGLDLSVVNWFTSGTGTVTRDTSIFRTGPASLKWTPGATLGSLQYFSIAAAQGAYTLSSWVYVPSGSGLTSIDCGLVSYTSINNVGYTSIVQTNFPVTVFDTWFRISQTLPSLAAGINALGPKLIPHGSGIFYVDDIQLEPGSTATTVAPFDAAARTTSHFAGNFTTDLTTLSDSVTRVKSFVRTTSDLAHATDASVVTHIAVARQTTDSAPASGALTARGLSASRALTQSTTLSDAVTRSVSHIYLRSVTDTVTSSDVVSLGVQVSRVLADTTVTAESITDSISYLRSLADNYPSSDALVESVIDARSVSDGHALTEAVTRQYLLVRVTPDVTVATDSVARGVVTARAITASVPMTDVVVGHGGQSRSLTDTVPTASASVGRALTAPRLLTQFTSVFDAPARSYTVSRAASEVTSVVDATFRRTFTPARALTETIVVADAVGHAASSLRGVTETTFVSDHATRSGGAAVLRFFTDFAHATDGTQGSKGNSRSLADAVNGADALARFVLVYVGVGEHVSAIDSVARHLVTSRATADHTRIQEILQRHVTGLHTVNPSKFGPVRARPARQAVLTSPTTVARPGPTMVET